MLDARTWNRFYLNDNDHFNQSFVKMHFFYQIPLCFCNDLTSVYKYLNCQALCPFLCLCLCVSESLRKWTQTDTKVTFHPPPTTHHPPTRKLFLVSNERYGKNKTFLLWWYGIDFALIKRYCPFCFLWLYIRRQRLSLYDLSTLCP